jgi:hypothetical protein
MDNEKSLRIKEYLIGVNNSNNYYTVAEYFKFLRDILKLNQTDDWSKWREGYRGCGIFASSICQERKIPVGIRSNLEFNKINSYPEMILAEVVFGEQFKEFFPNYTGTFINLYPNPIRFNDEKL